MQEEYKTLEGQLETVHREKQNEIEKADRARQSYEAKIKDLEEQIAMLKNESGDLVGQL